MRELSLFTGAGGGILGTHLLGWRPVGYVEWDGYCQAILKARIRDGLIPAAPIFGDIRRFVSDGYAECYRGIADVVSAGFPCQPFSVAGKQLGADDERNMWPATRDCIRMVRPQHVMLENVPGLIACGYAAVVVADLAALGYVGRWGVLGAADVGAPHQRDRLWIVGHAKRDGCEADYRREPVSDIHRIGAPHATGRSERESRAGGASEVADPKRIGLPQSRESDESLRAAPNGNREAGRAVDDGWWARDPADVPESGVGRVANGVAYGVDRLKAIGNGQVPAVVARAWRLLA